MSSSNADMISKRRFKLTKEIRKATLSGSEYYELKRVLELSLIHISEPTRH